MTQLHIYEQTLHISKFFLIYFIWNSFFIKSFLWNLYIDKENFVQLIIDDSYILCKGKVDIFWFVGLGFTNEANLTQKKILLNHEEKWCIMYLDDSYVICPSIIDIFLVKLVTYFWNKFLMFFSRSCTLGGKIWRTNDLWWLLYTFLSKFNAFFSVSVFIFREHIFRKKVFSETGTLRVKEWCIDLGHSYIICIKKTFLKIFFCGSCTLKGKMWRKRHLMTHIHFVWAQCIRFVSISLLIFMEHLFSFKIFLETCTLLGKMM